METFLASGGLLEDLGINPLVLGTQVLIFLATFLILSRLLFRRVFSHLVRREEELRRSREAMERHLARAEALAKEHERRRALLEAEAERLLNDLVGEAKAAAAAAVARAQAEAQEEIRRGREAVAAEKQKLLQDLLGPIEKLAFAVVEKVLETPLDPAAHGATVRRYLEGRI